MEQTTASVPGSVNWQRNASINWHRVVAWLVLCTLVLALLPGAAPSAAAPTLQPRLAEMATQAPATPVQVIVQRIGDADTIEVQARNLGAEIVGRLDIINAFVARMPASAALALAEVPGVRWISLDGGVVGQQADVTRTTWATDAGTYDLQLNSKTDKFNSDRIWAGTTIWFSSIVKVAGLDEVPAHFRYTDATIEFTADGVDYSIPVPDAQIEFVPGLTLSTTSYDPEAERWVTKVPAKYNKEIFLSGVGFEVPVNLPGDIKDVTWSGRMTTDTPDADVDMKWAAAVYWSFNDNYNYLNVKPINDDKLNPYRNNDPAGTPERYRYYVIGGARGNGDKYVGDYTSHIDNMVYNFDDADLMFDAPMGPIDTFATAEIGLSSFSGFGADITPGYSITRVELLLNAYVDQPINKDPKLLVIVGDRVDSEKLKREFLNDLVGITNRGTVAFDITDARDWSWADFENGFELALDQTGFDDDDRIYYDAIGLRITSIPGVSEDGSSSGMPKLKPAEPFDTSVLSNAYTYAVRAPEIWNEGPSYLQGQGVTVAVVDSGIFKTKDLKDNIVRNINFSKGNSESNDQYGHGTFVAGIIGGDGSSSKGEHVGIAPRVNLLNVRVSNDEGMSTEADVVAALQWIYENRYTYGIRVVNLSLNAAIPQSYHTSPMAAATEILWFNGIVVVVSAGNNGSAGDGILLSPADDPFVITVGATNDQGTPDIGDDQIAGFSAYGVTPEGYAKPDLVAPGVNVVGPLPQNDKLNMSKDHGSHQIDKNYFRMSGTSVSAPIVSGAIALLLQDEPHLNPDQVKYRLMATANQNWPGYNPEQAGAGYLDIYAAVHGTTTETSNTGADASQLLWTGEDPVNWGSVGWGSVGWGSVGWGSVGWGSVGWGSVGWGSVGWGSDYWDE
jgi:serine protease AprX